MSARSRRIAWLVAAMAAGVVLRAGVVDAGFFQDDAIQLAMLDGAYPAERHPLDLFRFADRERDGRAPLDAGAVPWWSADDLRIAMFRPLASALIAVDYAVFGADARAMHLHSMLWFCAALAAFALALRERFAPTLAGVAVLLFALDEAHTHAVGWIANRSYLVAETFGWLGVAAHLRAERSGASPWRWIEGACFAAALAAGEYGIAMLAFPFALVLLAPRDRIAARVCAIAPAVAAAALYVALRAALGYGTRGSGLYLDPSVDVAAWAAESLDRFATLTIAAIAGPPVRYGLESAGAAARAVVAAASLAALAAGALWAGRRLAPEARHTLHAFALAAPLAILPGLGAVPDPRLLGAAAGGVALVAAAVLMAAIDLVRRTDASAAARTVCATVAATVVLVHGAGAARFSHAAVRDFACQARAEWAWAQAAELPDDPEARVLLLAGGDVTTNTSLAEARRLAGKPPPRAIWRLSPYAAPHQVTRTGNGAIEVQVGRSRTRPFAENLYRDGDPPLAAGDEIRLDGLRITVLDAPGGEPTRLRVELDGSLDDPGIVFVHATPNGVARVALPPVGHRIRLAPPTTPKGCPP